MLAIYFENENRQEQQKLYQQRTNNTINKCVCSVGMQRGTTYAKHI